ncbi:MAG: FHA domain-containing protein [Halobacteriales archaeon]|nr:FHA domain-containing protein [Halobacteriales archaeon]
MVNGPRLYQVMEEFRKVGTTVVGAPAGRDATIEAGPGAGPSMEPGPKLVLVHGLIEGKAFPLRRPDLKGERGWVLGRKPGLHVSLDYDPYVSLENSEVLPEPDGYALVDLRSSRNGTWLNWRRLAKGERARLVPGDVIGVGRSLLVFRRE